METRKATIIPFLDLQPLEQLLGARCPTKGEVLFFFLRYTRSLSVDDALKGAVDAAR